MIEQRSKEIIQIQRGNSLGVLYQRYEGLEELDQYNEAQLGMKSYFEEGPSYLDYDIQRERIARVMDDVNEQIADFPGTPVLEAVSMDVNRIMNWTKNKFRGAQRWQIL